MSSISARGFDQDLPVGGGADDAATRALRDADRGEALRNRPETGAKMSERRGPFRPEKLALARHRMSGANLIRIVRLIDCTLLALTAFVAFALAHPHGMLAAPVGHALILTVAAGMAGIGLKAVRAYDFGPTEALSVHLVKTTGGFVLAAIAGALIMLVLRAPLEVNVSLSLWALSSFAAVYATHMAWWMCVRRWRRGGLLTPNIVIIGATRNAERLIESLLETREAAVLGVFDDRLGRAPDAICRVPVLGDTEAMLNHRVMPYVDRVVITVPPAAQGRVREIIERLQVLPNDVALFLDFEAEQGSTRAVSQFANAPLAQVSGHTRDEDRAFAKRIQDLVLGAIIFILCLPVLVIIALAVKLDSPGPVMFRQRRHGFNNEEIVVWKFRSMRHETADARAERQVTAGDDRITRVGRFIRNTSLDELPQILNVLKGEMSLVGPRPHAIGMKTGDTESARLVAEYAHRHRMKPGITGWAAIHGSRGPVDTPEDVRRRVELDVDYIERHSFWLDIYIMLMTVPCLLGDRSTVR